MITKRQNAAINLAKAYHMLAIAAGATWHINNAQEHLDCACDGNAETFDFDAAQHALEGITAKLIEDAR